MEVLVQWFTDNLSQHISRELIIFIISMIPILELRGGLLAASLLKVSAAKAIPICIIAAVCRNSSSGYGGMDRISDRIPS